ncbi:MAG: BtpA/SgcQ family protein [Planctomycetes bacterium]|nr:BtpA/SgcQ family protein [Planctomycetota bacterium]
MNNNKPAKNPKPPATLSRLRLIAMVHLPALPGSARAVLPMQKIIDRAVREAKQLEGAGFDAVIVENFGDAPFHAECVPRESVAAMSVVVDHVVRAVKIPVGVNMLRNDGLSGLAVACATGAAFIRVNVLSGVYATDQGFITGHPAELLARRAAVAPNVFIASDVHVKHAQPISQPDIALAAEETAHRAGADALIVSGVATGSPADMNLVKKVANAVPDFPVWIGSGVTAATVGDYVKIASGVIVGTSLKKGGQTTAELDAKRVREFIRAAK